MAFASHAGLNIDLSTICANTEEINVLHALFNQESGAVIQISVEDRAEIMAVFAKFGLENNVHSIARPVFEDDPTINIRHGGEGLFNHKTAELHKAWSTVSDRIRMQRENPETVQSESDVVHDYSRKAIEYKRTFDLATHPAHTIIAEYNRSGKPKPKVAILRAP